MHWLKKFMDTVNQKINNLDLEEDKSVMEFIDTMDTGLYFGRNADGNDITVGIEKGIGMRISTYQKNNWIRIMDYYTETDEITKQKYIVRTESYEKCGDLENENRTNN